MTELKTTDIIDKLLEIRGNKKENAKLKKELDEAFKTLEQICIQRMKDDDIHNTGNSNGTLTIGESEYIEITNWDEALAYVLENNLTYMLERKLKINAVKEAYNMGMPIPGTEIKSKPTLSLRAKRGKS